MITAINIDTSLWNQIVNQLKSKNWVETHRYVNFDSGIDFDFVILSKEGEEVICGWDNWFEGEIQISENKIHELELKLGVTLEKGEPVHLKPEAIRNLKITCKI